MSVLSDIGIREAKDRGDILVDPWIIENVQPASLDIRLGPTLRVLRPWTAVYDPESPPTADDYTLIDLRDDPYPLRFGNFVLGATLEKIFLGRNHTAHIDGISSLGRLGLADSLR